jgi:hypothetical protein
MIIDADVHISPFELGNSIHTMELIHRMDRSHVDKALTWLQPPYFPDIVKGNKYVYQATKIIPTVFSVLAGRTLTTVSKVQLRKLGVA